MGKMKSLLMEVQANGVTTMPQYLALRNMVIGKAMVTMNDRKRIQLKGFTRREFETVCLEIQKLMGVRVNVPRGHEWNMVTSDRIHNALQKMVKQGYLEFEVINGTFNYHITSKNIF